MFGEAMNVALVSGGIAIGGIVLHHEYPNIRNIIQEYLNKKTEYDWNNYFCDSVQVKEKNTI
jgi:hypothetical protein